MYYYIILLFLIIFVKIFLSFSKFKNKDLMFLNISFVILFSFLALRSETIGSDLINYKEMFSYNNIFSLTFLIERIEPGYAIYSYVIYHMTNANYHYFLVITAFFSLYGVYHFVKNNSKNYLLSLIIYISLSYYFFIFSGLRQALALSITLYSIKYIKGNNFWKFLLSILIAISFHKSAFVFLPVYFIRNFKIKNKHIPIFIGICGFLFVFRFKILIFFMSFLYNDYLSLDDVNGGFGLLFIYVILLFFATLFRKHLLKDSKTNNLLYNMFWIGIMLQIFATVEGNALRAAYYYFIPLIAFFPSINRCFKENNRALIEITFSIALIAYFVITLNSATLVGPYKFFWMR